MSANGIVRRIDELGRIVIPKEIRRTMRLREGDEMEIVAEGEKLVLRKYSEFENFSAAARTVVQMVYEYIPSCEAYIVTQDKLVAVAAKGKSRFDNSSPTSALSKLVSARSSVVINAAEIGKLFDNMTAKDGTVIAEPIIARGDAIGSLVVCVESLPDENSLGYVRFAAAILSAVISE